MCEQADWVGGILGSFLFYSTLGSSSSSRRIVTIRAESGLNILIISRLYVPSFFLLSPSFRWRPRGPRDPKLAK